MAKRGFYSKMVKRSSRFVRKPGNKYGPRRMMRRYRMQRPVAIKTRWLPEGLPRRLRTRLSYAIDRKTISGDAGSAVYTGALKINLNGPYDPEYAAGGAQPPLWDNYNALYGAYIVNSCTIMARVENYTTIPAECALLCLFDPTTNAPTFPDSISSYDLDALDKTQRSKVKFIAGTTAGSGTVQYIKKKFKPNQIVGRNYFTAVEYAGLSGGLPNSVVVAELLLRAQTLTQQWGAWVNIKLTYDVTFYDRKETEIAAYD